VVVAPGSTQSRFRPLAGRETCPDRSWCLPEPRARMLETCLPVPCMGYSVIPSRAACLRICGPESVVTLTGDTRCPLAGRSAALRVSGHLTGASLRALRQDPAEVAVLRPELDAPGVIRPGLAALRAGAGQLLIPSDPTIAAVGKVSHITEANPGPVLPRGRTRSRCLPTASSTRWRTAGQGMSLAQTDPSRDRESASLPTAHALPPAHHVRGEPRPRRPGYGLTLNFRQPP